MIPALATTLSSVLSSAAGGGGGSAATPDTITVSTGDVTPSFGGKVQFGNDNTVLVVALVAVAVLLVRRA